MVQRRNVDHVNYEWRSPGTGERKKGTGGGQKEDKLPCVHRDCRKEPRRHLLAKAPASEHDTITGRPRDRTTCCLFLQ